MLKSSFARVCNGSVGFDKCLTKPKLIGRSRLSVGRELVYADCRGVL